MPHGGYHRLDPLAGLSYEELRAMELVGPPGVNTPLAGQIDPVLAQDVTNPALYSGITNTEFTPPTANMAALHDTPGLIQRSEGTIPKPAMGIPPRQIATAGPKPPPPRRPKPAGVTQGKPPWETPVPSGKSAAAAGGDSVWKDPDFWLAAATAAGPVLGSLLQPRRFGPAPRAGAPIAGGAGQGQIQGVMGGPVPIDPRVMRPFG